ncbi:MAG TPA: UMP kinase [Patescibacteria group bacterium]|nr:UMP kinase [Patescibacteria group bacterium]
MSERKPYILKLTGELFEKGNDHISFDRYDLVSKQILETRENTGAKFVIVVGAGNIIRGRDADSKVNPNEADNMGMLATMINGVGLRDALTRNGGKGVRLMTAVEIKGLAEPYIRLKAVSHLEKGYVVVIGFGLGRPGFSTDTAVAQYAGELECGLILKASTTDGVYDKDPKKHKDAKKYSELTFEKALKDDLKIMDANAFATSMRTGIPIFVFDVKDLNKMPRAIVEDYSFGTLIHK